MEYCIDYALRDHELVDYSAYRPPEFPGAILRGPSIDFSEDTNFFTAIGAAQTYGVYVQTPFPQLLTQQLGLKAWNLGVGAAGPSFFLNHPEYLPYINKSKFVILQIMSARSEDNSRMESNEFPHSMKDLKHGDICPTHLLWQRVMEEEPEKLKDYMAESQDTYRANMLKLANAIKVPIIHFWFSPKALDAKLVLDTSVLNLMDVYPQFVFGETLSFLPEVELVTCHSDRDMRFPLLSRYTGKNISVDYAAPAPKGTMESFWENENIYYPSPQMHWDAAMTLGDEIRKRDLV